MRALFTICLVGVGIGLVYFIAMGVLHR